MLDRNGLLVPRLWAPGWRTPLGCGRCCSTGRTSSPGALAAPSKCGRCSPAPSAGVEWGKQVGGHQKLTKIAKATKYINFVKAVKVTKIKDLSTYFSSQFGHFHSMKCVGASAKWIGLYAPVLGHSAPLDTTTHSEHIHRSPKPTI